ncbi:MAG: CsbD family protein [Nitrospira sp.]|nr:CsbD family protein [Nitrospira sp.]
MLTERGDARVVPVVNDDQLKGNWKQFKGELKKKWADITDDDLLYIEGRKDKLEGKIQERYGDKQEEVKKWVDEWFERHDARGRSRTK